VDTAASLRLNLPCEPTEDFSAYCTVIVADAELTTAPDWPVTVTVYAPGGVPGLGLLPPHPTWSAIPVNSMRTSAAAIKSAFLSFRVAREPTPVATSPNSGSHKA